MPKMRIQPEYIVGAVLYGLACASSYVWGVTTTVNTIMAILLGLALLVIYFLPTLGAIKSRRSDAWMVFVCNAAFGWTIIGWVLCTIWGAIPPRHSTRTA